MSDVSDWCEGIKHGLRDVEYKIGELCDATRFDDRYKHLAEIAVILKNEWKLAWGTFSYLNTAVDVADQKKGRKRDITPVPKYCAYCAGSEDVRLVSYGYVTPMPECRSCRSIHEERRRYWRKSAR